MSKDNLIIIIICIHSFIIGYLLGRFSKLGGVTNNSPKSFFKTQNDTKLANDVSIDDKKIVVNIKTDGLEKKYESLGDVKSSDENISESVNKLKNLKR